MNIENYIASVLLVGAIYLPLVVLWGYKTFALSKELDVVSREMEFTENRHDKHLRDIEKRLDNRFCEMELRLTARVEKIEISQVDLNEKHNQLMHAIQKTYADTERALGKIEGKMDIFKVLLEKLEKP